MNAIGRKQWPIAEGYIPPSSTGPQPQMTSHQTVCLLNTGMEDAHVSITVFYSDRTPVGPYRLIVPAKRTKHVRFNDFSDPAPLPVDRDFASLIDSDVPIVVQHTRLDSPPGRKCVVEHDRLCRKRVGLPGSRAEPGGRMIRRCSC